jgi:ferredoxin-NADP reductase
MVVALTGAGVGVVVTLVRLMVSGDELLSSAYLVVTSYPIIFLALFMLTEPLTLPGRSRARLLVAIVVGVGVGLPFSLPLGSYTLYSSPELVLILGNAVALVATLATRAKRSVAVTLIDSEPKGNDQVVFRFALNRPLRFLAGQWIELHFPHRAGDQRGQRRVFSVASGPHDAVAASPTLEVWTRLSEPGSSFKHALSHAPVSSSARISQVGGDFVLPTDSAVPLLLIAGGVGITPFASQLADLNARGIAQDIVVVEVRSHPGDAWCDDLIRAAGATHIVTDRAGFPEALAGAVPDIARRWCGVSGSPGFVKYSRKVATALGARRVATDSFVGY